MNFQNLQWYTSSRAIILCDWIFKVTANMYSINLIINIGSYYHFYYSLHHTKTPSLENFRHITSNEK